jgi:hypothetical protein
MTGLRASVQALRGRRRPPLRIPSIPKIARVADTFHGPVSGSDAPKPSKDYSSIAVSILGRVSVTGKLDRREARDAAWCLWETKPALASHGSTLAAVIRAADESPRKQPFRALASSYLVSYAPDRSGIPEIGRLLARLATRMGKPWEALQQELNLFDPNRGPSELARVAVERSNSPADILQSYGLSAVNAQSGLVRHCIAEALQQMRDHLSQDHEGRLDWVKSFALRNERELLFEEQGPLVADALLIPFGDLTPPEAVSDRFLDLLLRLFGDPRLHPGRWVRMESAAAIVRRWLTKQSLRQFLEVVDQVANDRMWRHRRAFWEAVYDRELISDAWVVFGQDGAKAARKAFGKEISFATFGSSTGDHGHAVLLLRIGRGVVAEWSHSGKCIIWEDGGTRGAPQLHARNYQPGSLRAPKHASSDLDSSIFAVAHMNAEGYHWQGKVAQQIHQMTGVRINQSEYQVG